LPGENVQATELWMTVTDGLWDLVVTVGLDPRIWVGESEERLVLINGSICMLNMASVPCESTLLDTSTSVSWQRLLDSTLHTTAPSNRPLAHSPAASVKRSKETLGTDRYRRPPTTRFFTRREASKTTTTSPALHRQFPLYWSADWYPLRPYSIRAVDFAQQK
jgi:hypothetical protein